MYACEKNKKKYFNSMTSVKNIFGNKLPVQPEQQPAMIKGMRRGNVRGVELPRTLTIQQPYESLNKTKLFRNTNVSSLAPGMYLFVIEYTPGTNRYYKQFARANSRLELGTKHFQIHSRDPSRIILAAGEVQVSKNANGNVNVIYNLSSGTFMRNFIKQKGSSEPFKKIVENAFKNAKSTTYTSNIILNSLPPTKLKELVAGINKGYYNAYYNSNNNNHQAMNNLKKLHRTRVNAGNSSPNASPSRKRKTRT